MPNRETTSVRQQRRDELKTRLTTLVAMRDAVLEALIHDTRDELESLESRMFERGEIEERDFTGSVQ